MINISSVGYVLMFALGAVAGPVVACAVATKPRRVWPFLIVASVVTSGMMVGGYSLLDEYLIGWLLFGTFIYIAVGTVSRAPNQTSQIATVHQVAFSLMVAYMIFQSIRGMVELESLRKIRWVVFYSLVGLLPIVLRRGSFVIPSGRQVILTVTLSTLAYLTLYMVHGLTAEFFRGVSRWDLQRVEWGTTAYALLPVAVAMPAIIACLTDRSRGYRRVGWSTLVVVIVASLYYDSRVALLSVLAFFVVALPLLGARRFIGVSFVVALALYGFTSFVWPSHRDIRFLASDVFSSAGALHQTQRQLGSARDIDRYVHMQVAFSSITGSWRVMMFGHGFRAHGSVISERVQALYQRYGRADLAAHVRADTSTEGYTALLVDTGIVGLLLLSMNFVLVAWRVLRDNANKYRYLMLLSIVILFLWLFVINILDIILVYLAIMPGGLILLMNPRLQHEKPVFDRSARDHPGMHIERVRSNDCKFSVNRTSPPRTGQ